MDEGGFNEPYPEIKARLKPHANNICDTSNDEPELDENVVDECDLSKSKEQPTVKTKEQLIEELYAVPHKPNSLLQQKSASTESDASQQKSFTSTDSDASQITVVQQKSIDSDIIYNNPPTFIMNSVLSQIESQESYEQVCRENESDISDKVIDKSLTSEYAKSRTNGEVNCENVSNILPCESLSEASILDLHDVEYADASDNEEVIDTRKKPDVADAMTPAEAENLLSSR